MFKALLDWRVALALILVVIISIAGGVSIVSAQEQNDTFCGSCHTQPETTYLMRFANATSSQADDLAAFHHKQLYPRNSSGQAIRCIDCHSGEGLFGRTTVVSLAAWDALKYLTSTARQPAQVVFNIQNEGCLKCHDQQVKQNLDKPAIPFIIDNHYHYMLFQKGAPAEQCVACHVAHKEGSELNGYQFRQVIIPVCQDCHQKEGKGPTRM